ncbi:MAG: T9SS C-terminal target domain-containing protein [Calditrichaeota bacterium]|nr:MAG: T9SS C-terminal target domain-containing protein [Calditrichota bacterium]
MDEGGLSYRYWNVETDGEPTQTEFNSLLSRNIIWFTGWEDNTALTSANLTELEAFLLQGGNLFLTGVDVANAVQGTSFADNYLGGVADISGTTASFLKGNSSHPVGDGKIYSISTPTQNQRDGLTVSSGIIVAQFGTIGNLAPAIVVRDEPNFKTVLSGFEVGGITITANPGLLTPLSTLLLKIDAWWDPTVGLEDEFNFTSPISYSLKQNFPNPFNPSTQIAFVLPQEENVTVSIFNVKGQLVNTLFDGVAKFGQNKVVWNGTNSKGNSVASGIYFYKLQTESGYKQTKKMLLLK